QGVSERFPKSSLGVRRHRHAEEAELQFFLAIPRSEAAEYFLGQSKKRVGEEVIDLHLQPTEDLKGRLVCGDKATDRLRTTEQQECPSSHIGVVAYQPHRVSDFPVREAR
ncbi:MAG TPA: hypothetical protein VGJ13_07080, partial [Pseudonocardiaceae bacterium]